MAVESGGDSALDEVGDLESLFGGDGDTDNLFGPSHNDDDTDLALNQNLTLPPLPSEGAAATRIQHVSTFPFQVDSLGEDFLSGTILTELARGADAGREELSQGNVEIVDDWENALLADYLATCNETDAVNEEAPSSDQTTAGSNYEIKSRARAARVPPDMNSTYLSPSSLASHLKLGMWHITSTSWRNHY
jgi:hypothetical protein